MIVSIDGPAGSGKSTVATLLAQKLGYSHFNSGALYRGLTAYAIHHNLDIQNNVAKLSTLNLTTDFVGDNQRVFVDGIDYTAHLRDNEVSELTPLVSKFKEIRALVDACQRKFALSHNVVIEGRDIGSFVFPNAEYKFYLDCSVDVRAERRHKEEVAKGNNISYEEIRQQIIERDRFDKTKPLAPLVVPVGAVIIDSTSKTAKQVAEEMFKTIQHCA